jgi:uncharacterized damage-inducible protein DinB
MTTNDEASRFPIGKFSYNVVVTAPDRARHIAELAEFPARLRAAVSGLTDAELMKTYREGSWTVRQVVHHLADSHITGYERFKTALSENEPTVVPYDEGIWADLPDVHSVAPNVSVSLIDALNARWAALAKALTEEQFRRGYFHPEHQRTIPLDVVLAHFAWHGKHHLAHIRMAISATP